MEEAVQVVVEKKPRKSKKIKLTPEMRKNIRLGKLRYIKRNWVLYIMLLFPLAYVFIFNIVPLAGLQLAFRDYNMFAADTPWQSMFQSEWVGWENFEKIFSRSDFWMAVRNTLVISGLKILIVYPAPIIFAILLNEFRSRKFQRTIQTSVYLPHFLSWVVVAGICTSMLNSTGVVNMVFEALGAEAQNWLMDSGAFRWVLVFSAMWKEMGWNSIVFFSAITAIDQELYEAARIDGANRFKQMLHVTLPGIAPTVVMTFIIRIGHIFDAGFGQVFAMYNATVMDVADILGTYIYRMGLGRTDFSLGVTVGLFESVIGLILVVLANKLTKKWVGKGMW